ncbi:MAG TPA: protease modulator HflC [Armatimonadetes bacterium]|nr:protease modulator HflC [Armatimonadota bacterium]
MGGSKGKGATVRRWWLWALSPLLLALLLKLFTFTLDQSQFAVVTRLGRPIRVVRLPGLHLKLPVDSVIRFDRRLQLYDPPPAEYLTHDKKNLVLDAFVCWRVADPKRFLEAVRDRLGAELRLHDIMASELAAATGKYTLPSLLTVERGKHKLPELCRKVSERCRREALPLGIEVVEVRIKRLLFPEQNKQAVFARMRAERQRMAKKYRAEATRILAEAQREAERIKGRAEAEAAKIYAAAYNADPEFYKFMRTLEAYRRALDERTLLVLSADSEFLRMLAKEAKRGKAEGGD